MIELVKTIPLPPFACWICREKGDERTNRDYFVSTGTDTWDEGRIYICNICLRQMVDVTPDHMTKERSDELLSIQSSTVSSAVQMLNKWDEIKTVALERGVDLEKLLDGRDVRILSESSIEPTEDNRETIGDDPEPKQSVSLLLGDFGRT